MFFFFNDTATTEIYTLSLHDALPISRHDVDYREWRDIIENTETRNSSLRLTREEGYEIEDLVKELERKHKITTSMNELADRKSTRLNSSHANISYAVFCLKKKNKCSQ